MQRRGLSGRRSGARWTTLDWTTSLTLSAFWHLLVLLVLTLAVHPFQLPDQNRALDVELLPPLTPPPAPTVVVHLQPRPADQPPAPPVAKPAPEAPPQISLQTPAQVAPQTQPKPVEAQAQPPESPTVDVRPSQPAVGRPVEVQRRAVQAPPRLQTQLAAPQIPEAPPEPVEVTRPAPALQPQVEVSRAQAPSQSRSLETSRTAPSLPQAAAPEAETSAAPPSQVQVLTNQQMIQAPVEIRPRERASASVSAASRPGAAEIPTPGGGPPPGGEAAAGQGGAQGGVQGRAGRPSVDDFRGINGINGGYGAKGMRQTLGCENPDTYKLTSEERAACLDRFAQRAKGAPDLGLRISAKNQAAYDHYEACQRTYKRPGIPGAGDPSEATSITGLGSNPSLQACGPGER
jgi:hypothetical protein